MSNPSICGIGRMSGRGSAFVRRSLVLSMLALSSLGFPAAAFSASVPPLGTAASFAVLAGSAVANTGATMLTGDLGVSPGTAVDGFPPGSATGTTYTGAASNAGPAQADALIAYNDAAGQTCTTNMTSVDLGGKTLTPGVYCFNTSAQLTGDLVLDFQGNSNAVFVFQTGAALTSSADSSVVAINGSPSCSNVSWQIGSSATLGTGTQFLGNVFALSSITLTTGASNNGSLYALNGGVTLDTSAVGRCAPVIPVCTTDDECLDDDNVCTDQFCNPGAPGANAFGCIQPNNSGPCDDSIFCNGMDTCLNGLCDHTGNPCVGGDVCGNSCNELADNCLVATGAVCRASVDVCDSAETCTGLSASCPLDGFVASTIQCRASAGVCDAAENCSGSTGACPPDGFLSSSTACTDDASLCTDDVCNGFGACLHIDNNVSCDDGTFCTVGDTCSDGECAGSMRNCNDGVSCTDDACSEPTDTCTHNPRNSACGDGLYCNGVETCSAQTGCVGGTPVACGDGVQCTVDSCNEATDSCRSTPSNERCKDSDHCTIDTCDAEAGCDHEFACRDICRSPAFYGNRAGDENGGDENLVQSIVDSVGGIEVCGQSITETSNDESPYLEGLGLDSALESLCVQTREVEHGALYRELVTTALNCTMSGSDSCDEVVAPLIDLSFSQCDALCAAAVGNVTMDQASSLSERECIRQLRCYNNGGRLAGGKCALGRCSITGKLCGSDFGLCPPVGVKLITMIQHCERPSGNCHDGDFCQPAYDICPSRRPVTSKLACQEAKGNDCTIDSCEFE